MISGKKGKKHNPISSEDRQSHPRTSTQLLVNRDIAKLLQTTSPKRQRGTKLQRKIQLTTEKDVLFVLWRG
jgi:hypothetical protein